MFIYLSFLFLCLLSQTSHPGRWSGHGSSSSSLAQRDRRASRGVGGAPGGDPSNQHFSHHHPSLHSRPSASERHTAREERLRCQGALAQSTAPVLASGASSAATTVLASPAPPSQVTHPGPHPNQCTGAGSAADNHSSIPSLTSRQSEVVSSSSESLNPAGAGGVSQSGGVKRGGGEHHLTSHIPRAVGASSSSSLLSLASRGSPSPSISSTAQASPPPRTPSSASSSSSSTFTGRLGQPPRGPLSLHSYSRKNVFLQHSLHTSELQALTQRDS